VATMNFSIPDDVKEAFNREFAGQNKSAVISRLMRKAVAEEERRRRRQEAIRLLRQRRSLRPAVSDDEIRRAREAGRE
jgi:hypothetical protein